MTQLTIALTKLSVKEFYWCRKVVPQENMRSENDILGEV